MAVTEYNDSLVGNDGSERFDPLEGDDTVQGAGGSDFLHASAGNDTLYGHRGDPGPGGGVWRGPISDIDTVIFDSARADVLLERTDFVGWWGTGDAGTVVRGWHATSDLEGTERMLDVERLLFPADEAIALDFTYAASGPQSNGARAAKLAAAIFGAASLGDEEGMGLVIALLDSGMSDESFAALGLYYLGATEPEAAVRLLWENVVGIPMVESYLDEFLGMIEGGLSLAAFAVLASDTQYNTDRIGLTGATQGYALQDDGLAYRFHDPSLLHLSQYVASVGDAVAGEGGTLRHTVTLERPNEWLRTYELGLFPHDAGPDDWGRVESATEGVWVSGSTVVVSPGVGSFELTIPLVDDALEEADERFALTVGHQVGFATIEENDGPIFVRALSGSATAVEGRELVHRVVLSRAMEEVSLVPFSIEPRHRHVDGIGGVDASHGVIVDGNQLVVPAGVSEFYLTIHTIDYPYYQQPTLTFVRVGGKMVMDVIEDGDPVAPDQESFFPAPLSGLGLALQFNDIPSGALSVAALRAAVIANTNEEDYWKLFDLDLVEGPHDATWTSGELGWAVAENLPATPGTLEALVFGTHLYFLHGLTAGERDELSAFVAANTVALMNGDPSTTETYASMARWLASEYTPAAGREGWQYAQEMVLYFTGLVQEAGAAGQVGMIDLLPLPWI